LSQESSSSSERGQCTFWPFSPKANILVQGDKAVKLRCVIAFKESDSEDDKDEEEDAADEEQYRYIIQ